MSDEQLAQLEAWANERRVNLLHGDELVAVLAELRERRSAGAQGSQKRPSCSCKREKTHDTIELWDPNCPLHGDA